MAMKIWATFGVAALLACGGLQAENIVLPLGDQGGDTTSSLPERGMGKAAVRQLLGNPLRELPPVGSPPISVWEYSDFRVFFEHNHVLHTVRKHRPAHPEGID